MFSDEINQYLAERLQDAKHKNLWNELKDILTTIEDNGFRFYEKVRVMSDVASKRGFNSEIVGLLEDAADKLQFQGPETSSTMFSDEINQYLSESLQSAKHEILLDELQYILTTIEAEGFTFGEFVRVLASEANDRKYGFEIVNALEQAAEKIKIHLVSQQVSTIQ